MRKRLCCLMSAILALSICMSGGAMQAIANDDAGTRPVAIQDNPLAGDQDAEELASQADSSDEEAPQATIEEDSQEPTAPEEEQVAAPEGERTPTDGKSQGNAARAGPDEAAALEPMAAPPLRTAGFHAAITSNKDSYSAGSTAILAVKYTIDRGAFQEGDTVTVSIPTEVASKVRFSVDPLHFSSVADKGDGTWELTFGPNALAALAGSFSMYITTAEVTEQTTAPVTVGGGSKDLTVIPTGSAGGVGTYTDAIMKDANDDKVSYGDYDYSEGMGDDAAQIGVYDSTNDETIGYRLFVNNKRATMDDVTVVDTLPDGMGFDRTRGVRVTTPSGEELDPSLYSVSISGQDLTFSYPGTLTDTVWVYYWVNARGGTGVKYTNRAEISYRSGGTTYQEHRNYVLQGSDYNAACGEKGVDKTVVSSDPADQRVTYTIKFWNSNGFGVGEIDLTDELDGHVRFVYADEADKFDVSYDEASHSVRISNTSAISGSETEYVRFVVDFSDVPEGHTVENGVGGNTTKTLKMPTVQLDATKTVDGAAPGSGQAFTFQLCDEQGEVLQERQNDGGTVAFDRLSYSEDDLAADGGDSTVRYTVREKAGDSASYTYDDTVYDVAVTLHRETAPDGRTTVTATPSVTKAGVPVASMTFDNRSSATSVAVAKEWVGPVGGPVTVRLLADGQLTDHTLTLDEGNGWADSFEGLPKYDADGHEIAYTIEELEIDDYSSEITGDAATGFTITNANTETVDVSGTKTWDDAGDQDGARPGSITVNLLRDGSPVDSTTVEADADGSWAFSFPGLPKYDESGHEYVYAVTEDAVEGYATSIDGYAITNTHTPSRTSVTVTKAWDDANDQDGRRPDSVMVQLYADGEPSGDAVELSDGNRWAHTWTELDQRADGQDVAYTVGEVEVPEGYSSDITGDATAGFTVTNAHTPETVSVPVTKRWVGPEGGPVTVRLLADGAGTGRTLTLSADNGWGDSFDDLAKYAGGTEVAYTVTEDPVGGYSTEVTGDAASGFTVTNTESPKPDEPSTPGKPGEPGRPGTDRPGPPASGGRQARRAPLLPQTGDGTVPTIALLAAALASLALGLLARRRALAAGHGAPARGRRPGS